ncbi:MAG: hypothetical protein Kow0097_03220 [Candidatus Bipolaricaulota bacterium]
MAVRGGVSRGGRTAGADFPRHRGKIHRPFTDLPQGGGKVLPHGLGRRLNVCRRDRILMAIAGALALAAIVAVPMIARTG